MTSANDGALRRLRDTWSAGNFTAMGALTVLVGEQLCESVGLRAGQRVLDVATGSGNTALSAARRWCEAVGIDIVPSLLETARRRAELELLDAEFREGAAEGIPFPDESFDAVLSTFGCMFAADHERAAHELVRVCRRGGKIGLACWTPDGSFGELMKVMARHVPPAPNSKPPTAWGSEQGVERLLGSRVSSLGFSKKASLWRYPTAEAYVEHSRRYFGPFVKAFESLDEDGRRSLTADTLEWVSRSNESGDGTVLLRGEYLEVVATK